jgi:DNA-binding NarL/FixJ family response regulator
LFALTMRPGRSADRKIRRSGAEIFGQVGVSFGERYWQQNQRGLKIRSVVSMPEPNSHRISHPASDPGCHLNTAGLQHMERMARQDTARIRFVLIHARVLFRRSLAMLLGSKRDLELIAEHSNATEAMAEIAVTRPDLILFDFATWPELTVAVGAAGFQGGLLAIAEEPDLAVFARALSQGVSGVFLASDSPLMLVQAMHAVAGGVAWVDQAVIRMLAGYYPIHEEMRLQRLSEREQAVLRGVLSGLPNREIGQRIGVSEGTVKATLQHLFNRTGVRTRSQLVRFMLASPGFTATQPTV